MADFREFPNPTGSDIPAYLRDHDSEELLISVTQAKRIICIYCRDDAPSIFNGKYHPHDAGDISPLPERLEGRTHIANNGVFEGWIHRDIFGSVYQCEAGALYEYERTL